MPPTGAPLNADSDAMPAWQRAFILASCSIIGAALAYVACDWGGWPKLTILPLAGELEMSSSPTALSIPYVGIVAWGAGGAACGIVIGALLCASSTFGGKPWSDRALGLFGAWAIAGILLAGGYYTWNLWPW